MSFDINKYLPLNDTASISLLIKQEFKGKRIPDNLKNTIYAELENEELKTHFRQKCVAHNRQIAENEKQRRRKNELKKTLSEEPQKRKKDLLPKTFECKASAFTFTDGCIILKAKSREFTLRTKRVSKVPKDIVSSIEETFTVSIEPDDQFKFVPANHLSKILNIIEEKQHRVLQISGLPILKRQIETAKQKIESAVKSFLDIKITEYIERDNCQYYIAPFDVAFSTNPFQDFKYILRLDIDLIPSSLRDNWPLDRVYKTVRRCFLENNDEYFAFNEFLNVQIKTCENHIESLRNDWKNYYYNKVKSDIDNYVYDKFNIQVNKEFCTVEGSNIIIATDKCCVTKNKISWKCLNSFSESALEFHININECVEDLKEQLTERINEVTTNFTNKNYVTCESSLSAANLSFLFGLTDEIKLKFYGNTLKLDCTAFTSDITNISTFLLGSKIIDRRHLKESEFLYFSEKYSKYILGDFYKFERDIEELWCKFIDGYLNPVFKKVYIYRNYGRIEFEKYLYTIFDPILKVNQQSNINNKDTFGRYINIDLVEYDDIYVISEVFSHFSNYDLYNNWPGKGNYLLFLLVKDSVLHIISKDYDSADYIIHIPDNWKKFVLYAVMQYFTSYVCNKRQQFKLFEESLYSFMRDNGTQYGD